PPAAPAPAPAPAEPQPQAAPAPAPAAAAPAGDSIPEQIERLAALQAQGVITPEEFAAGKRRLLGM
ncbi:SHOCT domain-containing protein, partial [Streptacidiphilus jiangxiensis]